MESIVHILIAEDEPLIALAVEDALEEGGYTIRVASSGREALSALESGEPTYVGMITDIRLGVGPDGWEIARRARELNPSIAIVYMSGDSAHEHPSRGVPGSLMVMKPFAGAQMVTAISTLLIGNGGATHP